jgi:hypothetical protein
VVLAAVPLVGAVAMGLALRAEPEPQASRAASPAPSPAPVPARAPPLPAAAADAAPSPAPPDASVPPPRPRTVKLALSSTPSGAEITVDGAARGRTPGELELPFSDEAEARIVLSLAGYHDQELRLALDQDYARHVKLDPVRRAPAPPPPAPRREKGAPVDPFAP